MALINLTDEECLIIASYVKLQGHLFSAHTSMDRNLRNNGDLKAG